MVDTEEQDKHAPNVSQKFRRADMPAPARLACDADVPSGKGIRGTSRCIQQHSAVLESRTPGQCVNGLSVWGARGEGSDGSETRALTVSSVILSIGAICGREQIVYIGDCPLIAAVQDEPALPMKSPRANVEPTSS